MLFPVFLGECGCPLRGGHISNFLLYKALKKNFPTSADYSDCKHTRTFHLLSKYDSVNKILRYLRIVFTPIKDKILKYDQTYITGTTGILILGLLSKFFRIRFIAVCRDMVFLNVDQSSILSRLRLKLLLDGLNSASIVLVNSLFLKNNLESLIDNQHIVVVYPEIALDQKSTSSSAKKKHYKIGFVGAHQLEMDKGYKIIERLASKYSEHQFHIFGNCKHQFSICTANMIFRGWTHESDMYSSVDLMLVPSVWAEPFGRVAAEAISKRVPVFCSDIGGLREVVPESYRIKPVVAEWVTKFPQLIRSVQEMEYEAVFDDFAESQKFSADKVYSEFFKLLHKEAKIDVNIK
jgi:glycosyltransferase involved in cell wall biosynthesis